jgi:hypothetical protein
VDSRRVSTLDLSLRQLASSSRGVFHGKVISHVPPLIRLTSLHYGAAATELPSGSRERELNFSHAESRALEQTLATAARYRPNFPT